MNLKLPAPTIWIGPGAARRFRVAVWAIVQTALAAGLAWYITRDVLGHVDPFFAPIAAAVCLWATNVVRAQLAIEMVIGVAVGIMVGTGVHLALGNGPAAMATAVLFSLWVAVTIGQGFAAQRPLFVNQAVVSAILIMTFPHRGFVLERLFDALIGGSLAVAFSILVFPKNPLAVLSDARRGVLTALRDILVQLRDITVDATPVEATWAAAAADQLHRQLVQLSAARGTARQLAQIAPLRWRLRDAVRATDRQAAQLPLLANAVLHLSRSVSTGSNADLVAQSLSAAIGDIAAAAAALADDEPAGAATCTASARRHAATLRSADARVAALAAAIDSCADELQLFVRPPNRRESSHFRPK